MNIALIIPFKNAESFLPRCMDSIKGPFEVFAVDDHSSDNSFELIDNYDNREYAINLITTDGHGVSNARNIGLELAIESGCDYITFLDADDALNNDAYEQITRAIAEFPEADIIQLNHLRQYPNCYQRLKYINGQGVYNADNMPQFWFVVWNKIFKAELLEDVEFDIDLQHGEDELFVLECLYKAKRICCSERIAMTHFLGNPQSLSNLTMRTDLEAEQRALIDFLDKYSDDKALCQAVCRRLSDLWKNPCYMRVFGGADRD